MRAVVIYESLTGNTRRAARKVAAELTAAGIEATACNITAIDMMALAAADLVVVGTWTDGLLLVGQRPGRAGRLRRLPAMAGKKAVVFCTYAIDPGGVLGKLENLVRDAGAITYGGMAIHRNRIDDGVADFVDRTLAAIGAPPPPQRPVDDSTVGPAAGPASTAPASATTSAAAPSTERSAATGTVTTDAPKPQQQQQQSQGQARQKGAPSRNASKKKRKRR